MKTHRFLWRRGSRFGSDSSFLQWKKERGFKNNKSEKILWKPKHNLPVSCTLCKCFSLVKISSVDGSKPTVRISPETPFQHFSVFPPTYREPLLQQDFVLPLLLLGDLPVTVLLLLRTPLPPAADLGHALLHGEVVQLPVGQHLLGELLVSVSGERNQLNVRGLLVKNAFQNRGAGLTTVVSWVPLRTSSSSWTRRWRPENASRTDPSVRDRQVS